jgi:hypothetical protein
MLALSCLVSMSLDAKKNLMSPKSSFSLTQSRISVSIGFDLNGIFNRLDLSVDLR